MALDASCRLEYTLESPVPALFMLRPRSGRVQWIMREEFDLRPRVSVMEFTDFYGNLGQRVVMPPGDFAFEVKCRASVQDAVDVDLSAAFVPVEELPTELLHYVLPSRYCQSDKLSALALSIVGTSPQNYQQVARIRTWIHEQVTYEAGSSTTSTSALETANTKRGVCRDFSHLGIALCRAINVPARMVVGFFHKLEPMDMHAWFEAYIGNRWFTFDATEDETRGNRIVVAYGRDAADVALATMFGPFQFRGISVKVEPAPPDPAEPQPVS